MTAPPLEASRLEHSTLSLWQDWLAGWYDGQPHTVGNRNIHLPAARLTFQQAALAQPMNGLGIHVVWVEGTPAAWRVEDLQPGGLPIRHSNLRARFLFLVRARLDGQPAEQAAALCLHAASQLYFLLMHREATLGLAQRGIAAVRSSTPALLSDAASGYSVRQLSVTATLRCPIEVAPPAP